jgi:hypothetical protein
MDHGEAGEPLLGGNVRYWRLRRGYSQEELAHRLLPPGRDASRVRCPLPILVCDQDRSALARRAVRAARPSALCELIQLPAGTTRHS